MWAIEVLTKANAWTIMFAKNKLIHVCTYISHVERSVSLVAEARRMSRPQRRGARQNLRLYLKMNELICTSSDLGRYRAPWRLDTRSPMAFSINLNISSSSCSLFLSPRLLSLCSVEGCPMPPPRRNCGRTLLNNALVLRLAIALVTGQFAGQIKRYKTPDIYAPLPAIIYSRRSFSDKEVAFSSACWIQTRINNDRVMPDAACTLLFFF